MAISKGKRRLVRTKGHLQGKWRLVRTRGHIHDKGRLVGTIGNLQRQEEAGKDQGQPARQRKARCYFMGKVRMGYRTRVPRARGRLGKTHMGHLQG